MTADEIWRAKKRRPDRRDIMCIWQGGGGGGGGGGNATGHSSYSGREVNSVT